MDGDPSEGTGLSTGRAFPVPRQEPTARLQVFLIADVRGYTRFTVDHGDEAAADLARRFIEVTRLVLREQNGRLVELRGDEAVAMFSSARSGVRTALALQERFIAETVGDPARPLLVGIGLDVGEAVRLEDGFRGAALNLAARLCEKAGPGEILATQELVHLAQAMDGVTYHEMERLALKGITAPVRVIRVSPTSGGPPDAFRRAVNGPPVRRRRRLVLVACVLAIFLLATAAGAVRVIGPTGHSVGVNANSVAMLDVARGKPLADVPVGNTPTGVTAAAGALWVTTTTAGTLSRIDLRHRLVVDVINVGQAPVGVAALGAYVWVAVSGTGQVAQVSVATNQVVEWITVGNQPSAITAGYGAVWVSNLIDSTVTRIDPVTDATRTIPVGDHPDGLAIGEGAVWVANRADDTVSAIDPATNSVSSPVPVGAGPTGLAVVAGDVWIADSLDKTVTRIDARTRLRLSVTTVGNEPLDVVGTPRSVWVSVSADARLVRLDSRTGRVQEDVSVGSSPQSLVIANGRLWVTQQPFESPTHFGGTLVTDGSVGGFGDVWSPLDIDPQWNYSAIGLFSLVFDGLVRMNPVPGPSGYELVPDLATQLPRPSSDGLTYSFTVRPGIRYSDGRLVKASDFQRGLLRAVNAMGASSGYPEPYVESIVGAVRCVDHQGACRLGVESDDNSGSVTIHLRHPDADLLAELSLPFAYPVPPGTPMRDLGSHTFPGTGPYMFGQVTTNDMYLVRNPLFHPWSTAAQPRGYPNQIHLHNWPTIADAVKAVEQHRADLVGLAPFHGPEPDISRLSRQYPGRVYTTSIPLLFSLILRPERPPFSDPIARQALATAIDRTTISQFLGSSQPSCGFVPSDFPGYASGCRYSLHGDLARARAILRNARPYTGTVVVQVGDTSRNRPLGQYLLQVVRSLGYRAILRIYPVPAMLLPGFDLTALGATPDFPAASAFYLPWMSCAAARLDGGLTGGWCDPQLDVLARHAQQEQISDPAKAQQDWVRFNKGLQDVLPLIPTSTGSRTAFVSARLGNYQLNPILWELLDQMWVR